LFNLNKYSDNRRGVGLWSLKVKFLAIFLLALTGFAGYHFLETRLKQNKISQEVAELQEQIDEFEKKNKNLEQLSSYLQTDDFKEREAKQKLNLVKEGEKVVIVKKEEVEKITQKEGVFEPEVNIEYSLNEIYFLLKVGKMFQLNTLQKSIIDKSGKEFYFTSKNLLSEISNVKLVLPQGFILVEEGLLFPEPSEISSDGINIILHWDNF